VSAAWTIHQKSYPTNRYRPSTRDGQLFTYRPQ
jgi:hypothetical protein